MKSPLLRSKIMPKIFGKYYSVWLILTAIYLSVVIGFYFSAYLNQNTIGRYKVLEDDIEFLSKRIQNQERSLTVISTLTDEIIAQPGDTNIVNAQQINQIYKKVEKLDLDYKKLQEIIIGNPTNIIEFALLIKEVDNLKESFKEHKNSISAEINRNYGLFRWFIYINLFIALTILGITVTTYYQSRQIKKT